MSSLRPSLHAHRPATTAFLLALALASSACLACSGGDPSDRNGPGGTGDATAEACPWEPEALLAQIDVEVPDLVDCGTSLGFTPIDDCFPTGLANGNAVQITRNNCIDCVIYSTYVSAPGAGKFHLYREADVYGDALRVVRVDSCADFVFGEADISCTQPAVLYSCSEPLDRG